MITVYDDNGARHDYDCCDGFVSRESGELEVTRRGEVFALYNHGDWNRVVDADVYSDSIETRIRSKHSLKTVREALAFFSGAAGPGAQTKMYHDVLQDLVKDIDRQRPLGSDGKHGNLHTPWCQCPDKSETVAPPPHER